LTEVLEKNDLIEWRNPFLTTETSRVDFGLGDEAVALAQSIEETLIDSMKGKQCLGLSAIQLGINAQAFAVNVTPAQVVFNPRLVDMSNDGDVMEEGCLSFPGLVAKVWRPKMIKVRFQTSDGMVYTEKYAGMTARVFMHEYDHCQGRVFFDAIGKMQLTMEVKRSAKRGYPYPIGELWKVADRSRQNRI
jgi:peptide deformylase